MELKRETKFNLDITVETEVLTYTYTGLEGREVMFRVDLGDQSGPLSGAGGVYAMSVYIDDVLVTPTSQVTVPLGKTRTIMTSRAVPIEPNDVISVRALGAPGDTNVNTAATVRDATPLREEEVFGAGDVLVDHDYPTADNLRVIGDSGESIENTLILAFLRSDYDAGRRGAVYVKGRTTTDANGDWRHPLALAAETYTFVFSTSGYKAKVVELAVA